MDTNDRLITSRTEFHAALRFALDLVAAQGCRELFLCDENFADWPLGEATVVDTLNRWAMAHRRLHMLARSYDEIMRRHPRWVAWRRQWSHVVQCRSVDQLEPGACPTLLLAPGVVGLRLAHPGQYRGRLSVAASDIAPMQEQFDAVSQQSSDAFPATTLGL